MMKKIFFYMICCIAFLGFGFFSAAHDGDDSEIVIENTWVRAMPPTVEIHSVYMDIINRSQTDLILMWAASEDARLIEIHRMSSDDGVMRMEKVNQVHISVGETQKFQPGGFHLMMFDVNRDLHKGDTISLILGFHDGSIFMVDAVVRDGGVKGSHG